MNEPKKRGRPAKVLAATVPVINSDTSREPEDVMPAKEAWAAVIAPTLAQAEKSLAQAYALRVWNGQSPDAPRPWRIERVRLALEGQNLPFEGVQLP